MTSPAGSAIVNAIGPIRQVVQGQGDDKRWHLVIAARIGNTPGVPVQAQGM
jgi:hypothetical protein